MPCFMVKLKKRIKFSCKSKCKIKFCKFEQSLAMQPAFVRMGAVVGAVGKKVKVQQYQGKIVFDIFIEHNYEMAPKT